MNPIHTEGTPLFAMVRASDPDTSHLAAATVLPKAGTDRARVRACLLQHPEGLTDFELAEHLHGAQTSLGKRRNELGAVDTGRRRAAPSGCPAIVWRLATP